MIADTTAPRTPRVTFKQPFAKLTYPAPRGAKHDFKLIFEMRDYFKRSMKNGFEDLSNFPINFSGLKAVKITVPIHVHEPIHQYGSALWHRIEHLVNQLGLSPRHAVRLLTTLSDASVSVLDGLACGEANPDSAAVARLAAELPGETGFLLISQMTDRRYLAAMDVLMTSCRLSMRHSMDTVTSISPFHLDVLNRISEQKPLSANDAWELRRLSTFICLPYSEPAKAIKELTDAALLKQAFAELGVPDEEKTIVDGLGARMDGFQLYECVRGLTAERSELYMLATYVTVLQTKGAPVAAKLLQARIDDLS